MGNGATKKGVPDETRPVNPRLAEMEQIVLNSLKDRREEIELPLEEKDEEKIEKQEDPVKAEQDIQDEPDEKAEKEGVSPEETVDEAKTEVKPEEPEEPEEAGEVEEPEEKKTNLQQTITIKVDGEEREVLLSEITDAGIRTLQKEATADKRLEEATRVLKQAQELSLQKQEDADQKEEIIPDEEVDMARIKELTEAIRYGDEDEAAEAQVQLLKMGRGEQTPTIPSEDEIVQKAVIAITQNQIKTQFSLPKEKGGFKDLMDDAELLYIVSQRVDAKIAGGAPDIWETYQEAGEEVRAKFLPESKKEDSNLSKDKDESNDGLEKKKKRKKSIDTVKSANEKSITSTEDLNPSLDSAEKRTKIVQDIRKARGQPSV